MKKIVLIGMMGSGKTTCGNLLAKKLGLDFIDCDIEIRKREGMSTNDIFALKGEGYYRDLETALCHELEDREDMIIATGGGMPMRDENAAALRKNSVVFMLYRSVEEIFDGENLSDRPLAQNGKQDFIDRFERRKPKYLACAHEVITNFETPEITVGEILKAMEKYKL